METKRNTTTTPKTNAKKTNAKKTNAKKTNAKKTNANGSYEFLISHFANPSPIIDAATMLAQHDKIDPQIAAKKVEQFLENAKLDKALEVRAGTGRNEGQYLISRVPQSALRKNEGSVGKKREGKKETEKATAKKATEERAPSLRAFLLATLRNHPLSKEEILAQARKQYPHLKESTLTTTFADNIGGRHLYLPQGWEILVEKKDDKVQYQTRQI